MDYIELLEGDGLVIKTNNGTALQVFSLDQESLLLKLIHTHVFEDDNKILSCRVFRVHNIGIIIVVHRNRKVEYSWISDTISHAPQSIALVFKILTKLPRGTEYCGISFVTLESRIVLYIDNDVLVSDRIVSKEKVSLSAKALTITTDYGIFKNIMKETNSEATIDIAYSALHGTAIMVKKINVQSQLPSLQWGIWDFQAMKLKLTWRMYFMDDMLSFSFFSTQKGDELGLICTANKVCLVDSNGILCDISTGNIGFITSVSPCRVSAQLQSTDLHYFIAIGNGSQRGVCYLVVDTASYAVMLMLSSATFYVVNTLGFLSKDQELLPYADKITHISGKLDYAEELGQSASGTPDIDYCGHEDGKVVLLVQSISLGTQIWSEEIAGKNFTHATLGNISSSLSCCSDLSAANILTEWDRNGMRQSLVACVQNCRNHSQLTFFQNSLTFRSSFSQELDFAGVRDCRVVPVLEFMATKPTSANNGSNGSHYPPCMGLVLTSRLAKQSSLLVCNGGEGISNASCELSSTSGLICNDITVNAFSIRNSVMLQVTSTQLCAFPLSISPSLSVAQQNSDTLGITSNHHKCLWSVSIYSLLTKYVQSLFPKEVKTINDNKLTITSAVLGHNVLYVSLGRFIAIIYIALDQIPFSTGNNDNGQISCISKVDLLVEKNEIKHLYGISFMMPTSSSTENHHGVSCVLVSFWNSCELIAHTYFTSSMGHKTSNSSTMYKRDSSFFTISASRKSEVAMITDVALTTCGSAIMAVVATSLDRVFIIEMTLPTSPAASGSVDKVNFRVVHDQIMPNIVSLTALPMVQRVDGNKSHPSSETVQCQSSCCVAISFPTRIELMQISICDSALNESPPNYSVKISHLMAETMSPTILVAGHLSVSSNQREVRSPLCQQLQLSIVMMRVMDAETRNSLDNMILYQGTVDIDFKQLRCNINRSIVLDGNVECFCFNPALSVAVGVLDSPSISTRDFEDIENNVGECWHDEGDIVISIQRERIEERHDEDHKFIFIASALESAAGLHGCIPATGILKLPITSALKSIFEPLQHSKSILPLKLCALSVDPYDPHLLANVSKLNIGFGKRVPEKEELKALCHLLCVDSWKWDDNLAMSNGMISSESHEAQPIVVNTLHFITLGFDEGMKVFRSLSHLSYDFFDVEIMKYFQRCDSLDESEGYDFGSRLQYYAMYYSAVHYDIYDDGGDWAQRDDSHAGKKMLIILTQDGKLQVLGWRTAIQKSGSTASAQYKCNGIEVTANDLKTMDSAYANIASVEILASCFTVANSEYYYFFNQHEEAAVELSTQSKFARDKLYHQYINETSLGQYDLYQGLGVHDCFIAVSISLLGLKLFRLVPVRSELGELNYEFKSLADTIDKTMQMTTLWMISRRGSKESNISAVIKVFGYDRSEVLSDDNPEKRYIRVVTYTIYSQELHDVALIEPHGTGLSTDHVFTQSCFSPVPKVFSRIEIAKVVPRHCYSAKRYSLDDLESWAKITDVSMLLRESFDVFDTHGDICSV